jgi:hypothetical protein
MGLLPVTRALRRSLPAGTPAEPYNPQPCECQIQPGKFTLRTGRAGFRWARRPGIW